jgi:hypothetical protein
MWIGLDRAVMVPQEPHGPAQVLHGPLTRATRRGAFVVPQVKSARRSCVAHRSEQGRLTNA